MDVPINNKRWSVSFDIRESSPVSVAEALCDNKDLDITSIEALVFDCK